MPQSGVIFAYRQSIFAHKVRAKADEGIIKIQNKKQKSVKKHAEQTTNT